jgi:AraC-like DNA-binding protein
MRKRRDPLDDRTACAFGLRPMLAYASTRGVDVDAFLAELGVRKADLGDPDARISERVRERAWREAAERSGDPAFGLHVAERTTFKSFDALGYSIWASATLEDALVRTATFHRILSDAVAVRLEPRAGPVRRLTAGLSGHSGQCFFALIILRARELTGKDIKPMEMCFTDAPPLDDTLYRTIFECPVRFRCEASQLSLDARDVALPVRSAEPVLAAILDRQLRSMVSRLPDRGSFMQRVEHAVGASLGGGRPTLESTARALKTPPRTLQRRLRDHSTTHRDVVDTVRRDLAARLIGAPEMSITEIAFLLGFSDVSGFRRTYKRWTGTAPARSRDDVA